MIRDPDTWREGQCVLFGNPPIPAHEFWHLRPYAEHLRLKGYVVPIDGEFFWCWIGAYGMSRPRGWAPTLEIAKRKVEDTAERYRDVLKRAQRLDRSHGSPAGAPHCL